MLFSITSFRAAISASFCLGHSSVTDLRKCLAISMMAVFVGIFVYIDTASAVKSLVLVDMRWNIVVDGVRSCYENMILVVSQWFVVFGRSKCPGDVVDSQGMQRLVDSSDV